MIEREEDRFYSAGFSVYERVGNLLDGSWSGRTVDTMLGYSIRDSNLGLLTPSFIYQISTILYNEDI